MYSIYIAHKKIKKKDIDRTVTTDRIVIIEKVVTTENLKYYMRSYLSFNSAPHAEACISFMFNLDKLSRNNQ